MWILAITWKIDEADVYDLLNDNLFMSRDAAMEELKRIALEIIMKEETIIDHDIMMKDENSFYIRYTYDIKGDIYEGCSSTFCIKEYHVTH